MLRIVNDLISESFLPWWMWHSGHQHMPFVFGVFAFFSNCETTYRANKKKEWKRDSQGIKDKVNYQEKKGSSERKKKKKNNVWAPLKVIAIALALIGCYAFRCSCLVCCLMLWHAEQDVQNNRPTEAKSAGWRFILETYILKKRFDSSSAYDLIVNSTHGDGVGGVLPSQRERTNSHVLINEVEFTILAQRFCYTLRNEVSSL